MFGVPFAFGLTLTALLLAAGHWFPWPKRLHRLLAYTYGVGAILAGAAIWLGLLGLWTTWLGFLAFAVIGGAVTALAYGIDGLLNLWLRTRHHERNG
jgi:hypothetical protein